MEQHDYHISCDPDYFSMNNQKMVSKITSASYIDIKVVVVLVSQLNDK